MKMKKRHREVPALRRKISAAPGQWDSLLDSNAALLLLSRKKSQPRKLLPGRKAGRDPSRIGSTGQRPGNPGQVAMHGVQRKKDANTKGSQELGAGPHAQRTTPQNIRLREEWKVIPWCYYHRSVSRAPRGRGGGPCST